MEDRTGTLIPRLALRDIRDDYVAADRSGMVGRKPLGDADAKGDALTLRIEWSADNTVGWGTSLRDFLDRWPATFPENPDGPGSVTSGAPSPDRGTPPAPDPTDVPPKAP